MAGIFYDVSKTQLIRPVLWHDQSELTGSGLLQSVAQHLLSMEGGVGIDQVVMATGDVTQLRGTGERSHHVVVKETGGEGSRVWKP